MKYIDADKLIAEIERRREKCADIAADERNEEVAEYYRGKEVAYDETSDLITSLQQDQSEVDLEKAYKSYIESRKDDLSGNAVTVNMKDFARHFYERGQSIQYQKDRAEFAKLKAKEWQKGFDEGLNAGKED